jgi:uncharacterized membrane protein
VRDESTRSRHQGTERFDPSHREPSGQPKGLAALLGGAALVAYAVYKGTSKSREPGAAPRHEPLPSQIDVSLTINQPQQELYSFWRQLENLPRFMRHLESVHDLGNGRSHWVAKSPLKTPVEWDAEIADEREGQIISWRSVPGSEVYNAGTVLFEPAAGGRGTTVRVHLEVAPPGGPASRMAARLLEPITRQQVHEDLRRFKSLMEAGEIPTTVGQPVGERGVLDPRNPL